MDNDMLARVGLGAYFHFYNTERRQQVCGCPTTAKVHDTGSAPINRRPGNGIMEAGIASMNIGMLSIRSGGVRLNGHR